MTNEKPARQLAARIEMMPRDTHGHGKVSGGVLLCHIDLAAAVVARGACTNPNINRMVTRAMDKVEFRQSVFVNDVLTLWGTIIDRGVTSVTVHVEVEADRAGKIIPVTDAVAVFVALDADGKPTPLKAGDTLPAPGERRQPQPAPAPAAHEGERTVGLRKVMMPAEINGMGNIFGGLLLTYMDMAGAYVARRVCANHVIERCATRFMDKVEFKKPVHVNDLLTCWGTVTRVGTTSIHVHVEVEAQRKGEVVPVTSCDLVFVAVDAEGKKIPVACTVSHNAGSAARVDGDQSCKCGGKGKKKSGNRKPHKGCKCKSGKGSKHKKRGKKDSKKNSKKCGCGKSRN